MADQDDVRRIALALPETVEDDDRFAFSVLRQGQGHLLGLARRDPTQRAGARIRTCWPCGSRARAEG